VRGRDLRPLLDEERDHWAEELAWDFAEVTASVSRGIDEGTVVGRVLEDGPRFLAYAYAIADGPRLALGSVYAASDAREVGLEERLVSEVIVEAQRDPRRRRIESQTLFSTGRCLEGCYARAGFAWRPRLYLRRDLRPALGPCDGPGQLRPLGRRDLDSVAQLIYRSHVGSLDAALNTTYATPRRCRGFVDTVVVRGGCGRFDSDASRVAEVDGRLAGVVLVSRLSRTNGHICQVSVADDARNRGIGTKLVVEALRSLARDGVNHATLSVTVGNDSAQRLYERLGFTLHKRFGAHAWVRPPERIELPA
jgi:ribosomal protein S18 acetylase RimI-like enzyme